jgi:RimJ/RimL family protein N-acetyltransferase
MEQPPVVYKHKEGVHFRKLAECDLDILMDSKASSWTYTHGFLIPTVATQREWFRNIDKSETDLVLTGLIAQNNMMIPFGIATFYNIDRHNRSLQIGGHIFPDYRKSGKAVKGWYAGIDFAFEMLNMNRVYGEVLETNTGALKLDELTMKKEGVKRQACYQSGRYLDSVMFGLLREEWEQSDRVKAYEGCCNTQLE